MVVVILISLSPEPGSNTLSLVWFCITHVVWFPKSVVVVVVSARFSITDSHLQRRLLRVLLMAVFRKRFLRPEMPIYLYVVATKLLVREIVTIVAVSFGLRSSKTKRWVQLQSCLWFDLMMFWTFTLLFFCNSISCPVLGWLGCGCVFVSMHLVSLCGTFL